MRAARFPLRAAASLVVLVLLAPRSAHSDAPTAFYVDGTKRTLEAGLEVSADGALWIADVDLRGALSVATKRLIPRPPEVRRPRARPRRDRASWILCSPTHCATYRGEVQGTHAQPTFDLGVVARTLGYRVRSQGTSLYITTSAAGRRATRARVGMQVGDLVLRDLAGKTHRLGDARGRRVLIATWGTWSTSRGDLDEWLAAWSSRAGKALDLWLVALDVEGAERVRSYAPAATKAKVLVDRDADLLRRLPLTDAGHWFLLDELGILRAEHKHFGEADRAWLDLHLQEPLVASAPVAPPPVRPAVELQILRERVAAEPENVAARLALAHALESKHPADARAQVQALVELVPRSVPFAFRLARMHLDAGAGSAALRVLDEARRRVPRSWVLRKQYWALEQPNRFYAGAIDLAWQKKRREEERAWIDPKRRR